MKSLVLLMAFVGGLPSQDQALNAHVRVVTDSRSDFGMGSGVVIYTEAPSAAHPQGYTEVLTNKHVVADAGRQFSLEVQDDDGDRNLFRGAPILSVKYAPNGPTRDGRMQRGEDLCVICVGRGPAAGAARLAPRGHKIHNPVMSVGSDVGGPPTVWTTNYVDLAIDDVTGIASMRLAREAALGRSGGAIYDSDGYLVGVVWGTSPRPMGDGMARAVDLVDSVYIEPYRSRSGTVVRVPGANVSVVTGQPQPRPQPLAPAQQPAAPKRPSPPNYQILFFHRAEDPVGLYRLALQGLPVMYLDAEGDGSKLAEIWGVKATLPEVVVVSPSPEGRGSYMAIGRLIGSKVTREGINLISGQSFAP